MEFTLFSPDIFTELPFLLLYTEMHFRFRLTGSRYFKPEPEILADIPHRINLNTSIPLMLLVKDADRYPIFLENIHIRIRNENGLNREDVIEFNQHITDHFWSESLEISRDGLNQSLFIEVLFNYEVNGMKKSCINHNLALLPSSPMEVYLNRAPMPGEGKIYWGDLHYHSQLTEDMVEFGAPLRQTVAAGKSLGLSFFCPTDHSYDLDDLPGSWIISDPDLQKWNHSRREIERINESHPSCLVIPSEEVTVRNSHGHNIHVLVLNAPDFIPGSGDGAEHPFQTRSEHSIRSLSGAVSASAMMIAAHPFTPTPFFQWFVINRGKWEKEDCLQTHISGFQIMNGSHDAGFVRGREIWLKFLKAGYRKFIYAGNDAHGNFNRFRQIHLPMVSLWEKRAQIFGEWKTGVFATEHSVIKIIEGLRAGQCIISDGPFISFHISAGGYTFLPGQICAFQNFTLNITGESSLDYGKILWIKIFKGKLGENENCIKLIRPEKSVLKVEHQGIKAEYSPCYFRVELETEGLEKNHFAMTNPIWVEPK